MPEDPCQCYYYIQALHRKQALPPIYRWPHKQGWPAKCRFLPSLPPVGDPLLIYALAPESTEGPAVYYRQDVHPILMGSITYLLSFWVQRAVRVETGIKVLLRRIAEIFVLT